MKSQIPKFLRVSAWCLLAVCFLAFVIFPLTASAQSLAPTGFSDICSAERGFGACIQQLYLFSLGLAALIALFMLILAGYRYMTAAGNSDQVANAKEAFRDAFVGLIIIFVAFILLNLINPDLVTFKDFTETLNIPEIKLQEAVQAPGNATGGGGGGSGGGEQNNREDAAFAPGFSSLVVDCTDEDENCPPKELLDQAEIVVKAGGGDGTESSPYVGPVFPVTVAPSLKSYASPYWHAQKLSGDYCDGNWLYNLQFTGADIGTASGGWEPTLFVRPVQGPSQLQIQVAVAHEHKAVRAESKVAKILTKKVWITSPEGGCP